MFDWKKTLILRGFGLMKVPLLALLSPRVIVLNENRSEVMIPLGYLSKNHLGSMYFGVLAVGADASAGLMAMASIKSLAPGNLQKKMHFSFKDFHARFLKRPEKDTVFVCEDGEKVASLIQGVLDEPGVRKEQAVEVRALCDAETVAEFTLTMSLKLKI